MIARAQEDRELLREGGRRHGFILQELAKLVVPGVSTQALEDTARELVVAGGDTASFLGYRPDGASRAYPAALCVSINDVIVHGIPNERPSIVAEGDIVTLDLGVTHHGLITDAAVSVIAGTPRAREEADLVAAVYEALDAAVEAAVCGNRTGDIGYAVERIAKKYGYGYPKNLSGHGVGRGVHEEPYVPNFGARGSGFELVDGLVIAIEPMLTLGGGQNYLDRDGYSYRTKDGSRAAHAEHTVLITKEGTEVLTRA
jgi:methionyl aminopeptidase